MIATEAVAEPCFSAVAELVRARTGLAVTAARRRDFESGIRAAMANARIQDPERLLDVLATDAQAFEALIAHVTVGETYFFREPAQFDMLRQKILPELRHDRPTDTKLRFWSAGCASGEEAYSLAILIEEEGLADHACVIGTDISRGALTRAGRADYGVWSLRGDAGAWIGRCLHRQSDRFVLQDRFRERVAFRYLNLASDAYPSPATGTADCDVILCRNVLIYFDPDTIVQVARRLFDSLRVGGWLVTGPSDPPLWSHAPYETVTTSAGVFYRRGDPARVTPLTPRTRPSAALRKQAAAVRDMVTRGAAVAIAVPAVRIATADPLVQAREALQAGDFEGVLRLTREATHRPEACALRVRARANLGDFDRTEREAAAAIKLHPLCPDLHYVRAIILMGHDRHDEAVLALRRVIYLDCALAAAHFTLGSVLLQSGAVAEARRAFRNTLAFFAKLSDDAIVPLSDGERADRLAAAAQTQLALIASEMERTP